MVGCFNEIAYSFEKLGGRIRAERQMKAFRTALIDCDLNDLGYNERWYTWERGKFASTNIRGRLDHDVTSTEWWRQFLNFSVSHLLHSFSDHYLILVSTEILGINYKGKRRRRFKFDADWCLEGECEKVIQEY